MLELSDQLSFNFYSYILYIIISFDLCHTQPPQLDSCNFVFRNLVYQPVLAANNKWADPTAQMRIFIDAFVVAQADQRLSFCILDKQVPLIINSLFSQYSFDNNIRCCSEQTTT